MEYLFELAVFLSKTLIIIIGIIAVLLTIAGLAMKRRDSDEEIEVTSINKKYKNYKQMLTAYTMDKKQFKAENKKQAKDEKSQSKENKKEKKKIFVISFEGDMHANAVEQLREEITAILQVATKKDEVVVKIESPGGAVHGYGLSAAQLIRIKDHGCKLTICVDKMAASGGYMMACTGQQIIAAPFAILGSIGVIAQVPNLSKLLKKYDVDYEEVTAGEFKRTVSLFGEITEKGKKKFTEEIIDTHELFKEFVKTNRPCLNISEVGTGEYWFGKRALEKKLVDELMTSDEYLMKHSKDVEIFEINLKVKRNLKEYLSGAASLGVEKALEKITSNRWPFLR